MDDDTRRRRASPLERSVEASPPSDSPGSLSALVYDALAKGLTVQFRVKNDRLDYSIANRPLPTELSDHLLATALVEAGRHFEVTRIPPSKDVQMTVRDDGRMVRYKERIRIHWGKRSLQSSANKTLTLQVLSIVVENLMRNAIREDGERGGGPN